VIQILAKADGDQQQVDEPVLTLEEPPGQVRVTGVVEMVTDYPKSFAADRRAEEGMREALAQLAGVPADSVRVSLVPSESRADSLLQQPSEELGEIPPETPVDPDKGFKNEVSAWFAITLSTKSVDPTPEGLAEKLRDQDLTFAALKMQNCIMDEGLDLSVKVGRITAMLQTTTTTLAPGVIKKVDFGTSESGKGTSGGQTSGGDAGSDAARNAVLDSSIVSGDAATSPAKVVAVVASVSPDDVEPPTMSNPGGGDEESDDGEQTATKARHGLNASCPLNKPKYHSAFFAGSWCEVLGNILRSVSGRDLLRAFLIESCGRDFGFRSGVDGLHLLAFFIGVALTVTLFAAVHFALVNRRSSRVIEEGWKDAERGEGKSSEKDASRDVKAMCHKLQLAMELQMRQGCTAQEVSDRLDHILQLVEAPTLRESAMPIVEETDQGQAQPSKGSVADTRTPSSSNRSSSERSEDLPGVVAMPPDKMGKEPLPPPLPPTTLEPLKANVPSESGRSERS
ncbi:unnamed protein product, partial [Effrenium voratum]